MSGNRDRTKPGGYEGEGRTPITPLEERRESDTSETGVPSIVSREMGDLVDSGHEPCIIHELFTDNSPRSSELHP